MSKKFLPENGINSIHLNAATQALVELIAEELQKEAAQVAMNWAGDEETDSNVFMVDTAKRSILSTLIGFFTTAQPDHNQLTDVHVDAYFDIHLAEPPASKDPEPLED